MAQSPMSFTPSFAQSKLVTTPPKLAALVERAVQIKQSLNEIRVNQFWVPSDKNWEFGIEHWSDLHLMRSDQCSILNARFPSEVPDERYGCTTPRIHSYGGGGLRSVTTFKQ